MRLIYTNAFYHTGHYSKFVSLRDPLETPVTEEAHGKITR
jgi:hypothetical protein